MTEQNGPVEGQEDETRGPGDCIYLQGCRWPLGCDAEDLCIGADQ